MKYDINKMISEIWGIERWKKLSLNYKIYIRNNYKNTIIRRSLHKVK